MNNNQEEEEKMDKIPPEEDNTWITSIVERKIGRNQEIEGQDSLTYMNQILSDLDKGS